jgi:hypothetical protein
LIAIDFTREMPTNQRSLLLQVYAIERQENQSSQIVGFTIVTAALTYIVASSAFLLGHCNSRTCGKLPPLVQIASPAVLLALLSFLVLSVAATIMRAKHIRRLEELLNLEIGERANIPSFHRDSTDIYELKVDQLKDDLRRFRLTSPRNMHVGRVLMHRDVLQVIYVPLTLMAYLPTFLIALGYTVAVLLPGPWAWDKQLAMTVYSMVLLLQAAGILFPVFHPRFKTDFEVG